MTTCVIPSTHRKPTCQEHTGQPKLEKHIGGCLGLTQRGETDKLYVIKTCPRLKKKKKKRKEEEKKKQKGKKEEKEPDSDLCWEPVGK